MLHPALLGSPSRNTKLLRIEARKKEAAQPGYGDDEQRRITAKDTGMIGSDVRDVTLLSVIRDGYGVLI